MQQTAITKDANDAATYIASQQQQIAVLNTELQSLQKEYILLQKKYDSVAGDLSKQHTLGRLQLQIDKLERSEFELNKLNTNLITKNQQLIASEAHLNDLLIMSNCKYNDLKKLYEKNVIDMKPVIESSLLNSKQNAEYIQSIQVTIDNNMNLFKLSENKFHEKCIEVEKLKEKVKELTILSNNQEKEIKKLLKENDRKVRLSLVAIAAKSNAIEEAKLYERLLGKSKLCTNRLQNENNNYKVEINETEEYILQLQKMIEDSNKIHNELEKQLYIKTAELNQDKLLLTNLQEQVNLFNTVGLSESKQIEWKEREELIIQQKDRINKLAIQGRKYQSKVDELLRKIEELESNNNNNNEK